MTRTVQRKSGSGGKRYAVEAELRQSDGGHETVRAVLTRGGIAIAGVDGMDNPDLWPYAELVVRRHDPEARWLLVRPSATGPTLRVPPGRFLGKLREMAPHLPSLGGRKERNRRIALILGGPIAAIIIGAILVTEVLPGPIARIIPRSMEARYASPMTGMMLGRLKRCDRDDGALALSRAVKRLRESAGLRPSDVRVWVADKDIPNAIAVLGGEIVLFKGMIDKAEGPQEFLAVLAHELGHVVARHAMQAVIRDAGMGLMSNAVDAGIGSGSSQALTFLAYSRNAELEADEAALDILHRAGVASSGLVTFLPRVEANRKLGKVAPSYLSTHPRTPERLERLRDRSRAGKPGMSPEDWRALRSICDGP